MFFEIIYISVFCSHCLGVMNESLPCCTFAEIILGAEVENCVGSCLCTSQFEQVNKLGNQIMRRLECSNYVIRINIAQQTGFLTGLKMGVNISSHLIISVLQFN